MFLFISIEIIKHLSSVYLILNEIFNVGGDMIEVGHPSPPSPNNDPRKAGYPVLHLGPVAAGLYEISTSECTQGSIVKCIVYLCIYFHNKIFATTSDIIISTGAKLFNLCYLNPLFTVTCRQLTNRFMSVDKQ